MITQRDLLTFLLFSIALPVSAIDTSREADILYKQARSTIDADSASIIYRRLVSNYPRDTACSWALLRLAQYAEARGDQSNVEQYVIRLRELFPASTARLESASLLPDPSPVIETQHPAPAPAVVTQRRRREPAAREIVPAPAFSSATSYGVQLGAFSIKGNAARLQSLAMKEYKTEIVERLRGDKVLFCVIAGSFAEKSAAENALSALEKITGVRGVVIQR